MVDVEYELFSQVTQTTTKIDISEFEMNEDLKTAIAPDGYFPFVAAFYYKDALNVRTGLEYRVDDNWAVIGGYTWLQASGNRKYPTAFGAPPSDNHIGAIGGRYDAGEWEINFAYTYRYANTFVEEDEVATKDDPVCNTCTYEGDHTLALHGAHIDFSYNF